MFNHTSGEIVESFFAAIGIGAGVITTVALGVLGIGSIKNKEETSKKEKE